MYGYCVCQIVIESFHIDMLPYVHPNGSAIAHILQCPGVCRMNHRINVGAKAKHAEKEHSNEKSR